LIAVHRKGLEVFMNAEQCKARRIVMEKEVAKILRERYAQPVEKSVPIRYYLDFKADTRLLELRDAMQRMEEGTYGICLLCKAEIPQYILEDSPTTLLCESCAVLGLHIHSSAKTEDKSGFPDNLNLTNNSEEKKKAGVTSG
jgi:RNA polymerase-binding transcription factor DksA